MLEPEPRTHELAGDIGKFAGRAQACRSVFQNRLFGREANAMVCGDNHLTNLASPAKTGSFRASLTPGAMPSARGRRIPGPAVIWVRDWRVGRGARDRPHRW